MGEEEEGEDVEEDVPPIMRKFALYGFIVSGSSFRILTPYTLSVFAV